ncbi:FeoA family protein [Methanomassiliicoccus luminyensis]|jgi:Fe2+ transport system protein FeoA|uniref:FeoA family protein n=1 Tax=Methanomassiliicoccus luminyensis TaxID=1080712 RepID=UPI00035D8BA7|nr:FeoA family protein [Methanomassiliicoccus luminyensis]
MSNTTLDKLAPGNSAVIVSVEAKGPVRRRIAEMGLCPGAQITMVRKAPLNDPLEFLVRGYNISLRNADAATIVVNVKEAKA